MSILEEMKEAVCKANKDLVKHDLVILTWGNVSAFDPEKKLLAIKPSGVDYTELKPEDIVIVDLEGNVVEGYLRPSSDTLTHIEIYKHFKGIRGVVHTHSKYATMFAQAQKPIHCLGTTHCDHFYGSVPIIRNLTEEEINEAYEANTGKVIVDHFKENEISPISMPGCLCSRHAPFVWGTSLAKAMENAVALEQIAMMNIYTYALDPDTTPVRQFLLDKHFLRKHGKNAYYGQKGK